MASASFKVAALSTMLALALTPRARAHHSTALFDNSKTVTLKGTVRGFQWINPHVLLWVDAKSDDGQAKTWTIELAGPGVLTRNGWDKHTFKPGDAISVDVGPLRDGQAGGFFKKATLTDGHVLTFKLQP
jgi:hypothetical protein